LGKEGQLIVRSVCDSGAYDLAMKKKQPQVRKAAAKTNPEPRAWNVGDKVTKIGMQGPYEITRISPDGSEADLCLIGTRTRSDKSATNAILCATTAIVCTTTAIRRNKSAHQTRGAVRSVCTSGSVLHVIL
jgi:hypothetical protein